MSPEILRSTQSNPEIVEETKESPYEGIFTESLTNSDEKNIARRIFQIEGSGQSVVFINSDDNPTQQPLDGEKPYSFVEAKPDSILKKAIEFQPEDPKLKEILTNIESQEYGDDELLLLDEISACLSINNDNQYAPYAQTEGFALILSALSGNQKARDLVDSKLDAYYELSKQRIESEKQEKFNSDNKEYYDGIEPLTWGEVAFVHSTKYGIDRDEQGNVILRPHAHHSVKTGNPYPRATLHFTTNAEVESHLFGSWSGSNMLIVTNGQAIVDENGEPAKMNSIDTYWSVNPGQALKLDGASIVDPRPDLKELFVDEPENKTVSYLDKSEYTDQERLDILLLEAVEMYSQIYTDPVEREDAIKRYKQYHTLEDPNVAEKAEKMKGNEAKVLRRMALDAAMKQQNVTTGPLRLEQWSTNNPAFDRAYVSLSYKLGIPYGIHSGSEEDWIESNARRSDGDKYYPSNPLRYGRLEAQRTLVALGKISAQIIDTSPKDPNDFI
jgi:hypothetical protein